MSSLLSSSGIIVVACAVLSALLARYLLSSLRPNHLGSILLWMLLFPVTLIVAFVYVVPWVSQYESRAVAERLIAEDPLLSLVSERDSTAAREIKTVMITELMDGVAGLPARLQAFRQCFGLIVPHAQSAAWRADNPPLRRYASARLAVMRELTGHPAGHCFWFIGDSTHPDGSTFDGVSETTLVELNQAIVALILSADGESAAWFTPQERGEFRDDYFDAMKELMGPEFAGRLDRYDQSPQSAEEREDFCQVTVALFSGLARMPSPLREGATRAMLTR